ncbi:hypothetical protein SB85_09300 [Xanthomonas sacchari]|nr:hypothetical protein SB85_09300 [Xanthomonas sacchari]
MADYSIRLLQQQRHAHAALLAAGQVAILASHGGSAARRRPRRSWFSRVCASPAGQDRLQALLFLGQRVEIGAFLGIGGVHRFQRGLRLQHFATPSSTDSRTGLVRVQLRLLRQVADLGAGLRTRLAFEIGVHAAHDLRTVDLPAPLRASRPILAPGKNDSEMSLMTWRLGGTVLR